MNEYDGLITAIYKLAANDYVIALASKNQGAKRALEAFFRRGLYGRSAEDNRALVERLKEEERICTDFIEEFLSSRDVSRVIRRADIVPGILQIVARIKYPEVRYNYSKDKFWISRRYLPKN